MISHQAIGLQPPRGIVICVGGAGVRPIAHNTSPASLSTSPVQCGRGQVNATTRSGDSASHAARNDEWTVTGARS